MGEAQFGLSENDVKKLKEIKTWYERNKGLFGNFYRRNPRLFGTDSGSEIRRAITTAAAGAGATIKANLYNNAGVEQTSGAEFNVDVYCTIIGGTALNAAAPRLENDDDIFIVSLPFSATAKRWYCVSLFSGTRDC
jgi:hypothetical protein